MYTKYINKNIQETLKARERALARRYIPFGQNSDDAPKPLDDIVSRTPFVRMCSNKLSVPNKVIGGGEIVNNTTIREHSEKIWANEVKPEEDLLSNAIAECIEIDKKNNVEPNLD